MRRDETSVGLPRPSNYEYYRLLQGFIHLLLRPDTVFENPYVKGLLYGVVHSNISKTLNKSSEDQIASKIKNCISSVISNNDLRAPLITTN